MLINRLSQLGGAPQYGPYRKCSDKAPAPSRETSVSQCFNRGLRVGYAIGRRGGNRNRRQAPFYAPAAAQPAPAPQPVPQPAPQPEPDIPILRDLYLNTNYRASRRRVDFFKTLPILNPEFQPGAPRYLNARDKRALGTRGLAEYLISSGEYQGPFE
jgi:hypothetical protein